MNTMTHKLFDNYIRMGTYSDLDDVQSRIDYYVARNVITAAEALEYQKIAAERVCKSEAEEKEAKYVARIEKLEAVVAELQSKIENQ